MKVFSKDLKITSLLSIFYILTISCSAFCEVRLISLNRVYSEDYNPSKDQDQKEFARLLTDWFDSYYYEGPSVPYFLSRLVIDFIPESIQYFIRTDISKNHIPVCFIFLKDSELIPPLSPFINGNHYTSAQSEICSEYQRIKNAHTQDQSLFERNPPIRCLDALLGKDNHFAIQLKNIGSIHSMWIIISSDRFKNYIESYGMQSFVELFKDKFKKNEELIYQDIRELEDIFQKNTSFILRKNLKKYSKIPLTQAKKLKTYFQSSWLKILSNYHKNRILNLLNSQLSPKEMEYFRKKLSSEEFMRLWEIGKEKLDFKTSKQLLKFLTYYSDKFKFFKFVENWDQRFFSSDFRISSSIPQFWENYLIVTQILPDDSNFIDDLGTLSLKDPRRDYSGYILYKISAFGRILSTLNTYYRSPIPDDPYRYLITVINPEIYKAIDDLAYEYNVTDNSNIRYLVFVLKKLKVLTHFPNHLPIQKILLLEDLLEAIQKNPYLRSPDYRSAMFFILNRITSFESHELISQDSKINESINKFRITALNLINQSRALTSDEYGKIIIDLEKAIRQHQAESFNLIPQQTQKDLTKFLFDGLLLEGLLKPNSLLETRYKSPKNPLLKRAAKLLKDVVAFSDN
jgi:hypothetical protein